MLRVLDGANLRKFVGKSCSFVLIIRLDGKRKVRAVYSC